MASICAAYAMSVCNGSVTTQEDLNEIGLNQFDHKVKPGDVLVVPSSEKQCFVKVCPPGIPGYDVYTIVCRNGGFSWILVRRVLHKDGESIILYDLAEKLHYPGDTRKLLSFLGDLERPVTITKTGISW